MAWAWTGIPEVDELPVEACLLAWPDSLGEFIVASVAALAAPREPEWVVAAQALSPKAETMMRRLRLTRVGAIDLVVREFLNDVARGEYLEAAKGLWLLRGLKTGEIERALTASWRHPDVAERLAKIIRRNQAESFTTLGQWISAGVVLDGLLALDPYLSVVRVGVASWLQRQRAGETVLVESVAAELRDTLEALAR